MYIGPKEISCRIVGIDKVNTDVLFSFGSFDYQWGCTITAVSAQRRVEHVKNALQNIMTEQMPE